MKKFLLFSLLVSFAFFLGAQTSTSKVEQSTTQHFVDVTSHHTMPMNIGSGQPIYDINKDGQAVTIIPCGHAANAYGFYHGGKTALWADNDLNAVIFTHRSVNPGSGYLKIDKSYDGGVTWTVDIGPVYSPDAVVDFNARYPQGVIYNPAANTDPDNAYAVYATATLDGTNGSWGGVGYGTFPLDSSAGPTQHSLTSAGPILFEVPEAMTINGDEIFLVDQIYRTDYTDSIELIEGTWNGTTNEFDFTVSFADFPTSDAGMMSDNAKPYLSNTKIAFCPTNDQIGWIVSLTHHDTSIVKDEGYYPVLLKTIDGGATWSAPIEVPLINLGDLVSQDFIPDQELSDYFSGSPPPRSEIWFRAYFYTDMVVDANGNPHINIAATIGNNGGSLTPFSVYDPVNGGITGIFDIFSTDGGTTWDAKFMGRLMTMRGDFGGITEDNRSQAAVTADGSKIFFSWLDTDTVIFGTAGSNANPDIFLRGFDPVTGNTTPIYNVTAGTIADGGCYMGSLSHFVFGTTGTYTIPMMYQDFDPTDPASLTTYYYISGFEITDADFNGSGIETPEISDATVSQNYPNPFDNTTQVDINMNKTANVQFVVTNIMGQIMHQQDLGILPTGNHKISFDGSNLSAGIYFYTVYAGNSKISKKMNIE